MIASCGGTTTELGHGEEHGGGGTGGEWDSDHQGAAGGTETFCHPGEVRACVADCGTWSRGTSTCNATGTGFGECTCVGSGGGAGVGGSDDGAAGWPEGGASGAAVSGGGGVAGDQGIAGGTAPGGGAAGEPGFAGTAGTAGTPEATGGAAGTGGVAGGASWTFDSDGPSCAAMTGTECNGESCCTSIVVPGGTFPMGRGSEACNGCVDGCPSGMTCFPCPGTDPCYDDEQPEHPATVSSFALDKYEVTVGRFRAFVDEYDGTPPPAGAGAHPLIPDSGWDSAWNDSLSANRAALISNLSCSEPYGWWTDAPGANEMLPVHCVTHAEAFAFCYWDGGRLPTEAEWEYAAAGGDENRVYPWGNDVSEPLPCDYGVPDRAWIAAPVGSYPAGNGRWGHSELGGGVSELVLDSYRAAQYLNTEDGCSNCAYLSPGGYVLRGGSWAEPAVASRAAYRISIGSLYRTSTVGFRCARTPTP